eukprot:scaffold7393_cov497-Prasinococcus_capsulatus_cf.AAC.6
MKDPIRPPNQSRGPRLVARKRYGRPIGPHLPRPGPADFEAGPAPKGTALTGFGPPDGPSGVAGAGEGRRVRPHGRERYWITLTLGREKGSGSPSEPLGGDREIGPRLPGGSRGALHEGAHGLSRGALPGVSPRSGQRPKRHTVSCARGIWAVGPTLPGATRA